MNTKKRRNEVNRLRQFPTLESDPHPTKTGVLLRDEIEFYVKHGRLICPFDAENLKPAGYELTVGDEAMLGGKFRRLGDTARDGRLRIKPFEVVVIKTAETLNLPRFLVARWNIRVAWAYKGLLWVGGPQVDPGYVGNLFCPIYNLSDRDVWIKKGDPIALMDFVKTTPFDLECVNEVPLYPRPPKRVIIEDYKIDDFRSALRDQKDLIDEGLKEVRRNANTFTTLVIAIIAILMTAIMLPYFRSESVRFDFEWMNILPISLSLFAAILSIFNVITGNRKTKIWKANTAILVAVFVASIPIILKFIL